MLRIVVDARRGGALRLDLVAIPGGWWLDSRKMKKEDVAAHLVNLAWNGLSGMEPKPILRTKPRKG